ncbi:hypothetical protein BH11PSE8_BH11PSE8_28530 [soil metagenome]
MTHIVARRATSTNATDRDESRWLKDWRYAPAYVLLGDPGSGKTQSLRTEADAVGGVQIPAARIQAGLADHASPDDIVFIDAVDEVRGSGAQGSDVLGAVGRFLRASGSPRFRIACREADWRGEADRQLINSVAPGGELRVLHLDPMSDDDIRAIAAHSADLTSDVDAFLQEAIKHSVYDLLRNPLLLELMIGAVAADGQWPRTRTEVYEAACKRLAVEHSEAHRVPTALQPGLIETILADAGTLYAILLLSGRAAISRTGANAPHAVDLNALPQELALTDAARAIRSKVFTVEGPLVMPRHRTIAEFLGARALAKRVADDGLPLSRVLALMQGHDGIPVEAMRGLCAWLTVHLRGAARQQMLRLDPVGFIVNGDAAALSHAERLLVIEALSASAAQNRWFRSGAWIDHPFGPLATPDMADVYAQELGNPDRTPERQVFIDCLLDALKNAPEPIPELCAPLARWVADANASDGLRATAYDAWLRHCAPERRGEQLTEWLRAIEDDSFEDDDDRLLGPVLRTAYPDIIGTGVLRFFRPKRTSGVVSEFSDFWDRDFIQQTPAALLPALGDAWAQRFPDGIPHEWSLDGAKTAHALLSALLESHGDAATAERLYQWLGIGLDEYGMESARQKSAEPIALWLQARPEKMKEVAAFSYPRQKVNDQGRRIFWLAEARLHNATRPADWIRWNMSLAANSEGPDFVQWLVGLAASAAMDPPHAFDAPTMDDVCDWVSALAHRYPDAETWLREAWTVSLEDWRAASFRSNNRYRAEREHAREQRRKNSAPHIEALPAKPLPPRMLHNMAMAYEKRFIDFVGDTPEERVAEFVGGGLDSASKALQALDQTLARDDLPTVEEIMDLESKGQEHFLRMPALLAADRACKNSAEAWKAWSAELQQRLTAFWLTYGAGEEPGWFKSLCAAAPELVATILIPYAQRKLRRKGPQAITALWFLTRDDSRRELALRVLPELLEMFPSRAYEEARNELNRSLLSGLCLLPRHQALDILHRKLMLKGLDTGQRISWLVALLPYEPEAAPQLVEAVGQHPRRVAILGKALVDQRTLGGQTDPMPATCVQQLIELLAPLTRSGPDLAGDRASDERQREEVVQALLANLGSNSSAEAGDALQNLLSGTSLGSWRSVAEYQLQAQKRLFREASFTSASPDDVARLLCNGPPANVTDLLALLFDHIQGIERKLRGDPAFQLRQFWKDDGTPRSEEDCRDQLLAMLQPRLEAQKVDLQPESLAAAAKRMDMRAAAFSSSGRRLSLPVEAKRDAHREVWIAWRDQLKALYAIDPTAQGFGLYLVFWFGVKCTPSPEGYRPLSASDMENHIRARLPEADRSKLRVLVMDLSWPETARRRR